MSKRAVLITAIVISTLSVSIFVFAFLKDPNYADRGDWHWFLTADNLYEHGVYSLYGKRGADGNMIPTFLVTPGWPVTVWMMFKLFGNGPQGHAAVHIISFLMYLGVLAGVYLVGSVFSRKVGVIAAVLAFMDVSAFFWANSYKIPDVALAMFFTFFLYFTLRFLLDDPSYKNITLASLCFGLAALFKATPYLMVWPGILFIALWMRTGKKIEWKKTVAAVSIFAAVQAVMIGGWSIRNYVTFGYFQFSSQGGHAMLFWNAALMEAEKTGEQLGVVKKRYGNEFYEKYGKDLSEGREAELMMKEGKDKIMERPHAFAWLLVRRIKLLLFETDAPPLYSKQELLDMLEYIKKEGGGAGLKRMKVLFEGGYHGWLFFALFKRVHLLFVYGCAVIGMFLLLRNREYWWAMALMILSVIYLFGLASPMSHGRYRYMIMPIFYVWASFFIVWGLEKFSEFRRSRAGQS